MGSDRKLLLAIVDNDATVRREVAGWLADSNREVVEYETGLSFLEAIKSGAQPAVVCLDIDLADIPGVELLNNIRQSILDLPVIILTVQGETPSVVEAMRSGAYDYLKKPLEQEQLEYSVSRATERYTLTQSVRRLRTELIEKNYLGKLVGSSSAMKELARQIERVKGSDVTVAIFGESGTGKELVAQAIHCEGHRSSGPFVAINCAAIPESLQESELFGHEKGSFTGASSVHMGRFEQANGGTLFLDEIGEMSSLTQASLLRTIQERTVRRIGGSVELPVDVRIICATHRDLEADVKQGRFREDLYFRLIVYPVRVPPLRERKEDVPALVSHFAKKYESDVGRTLTSVSPEAMSALTSYRWPGNVRELENIVHRAMLSSDHGEIDLEHLPASLVSQDEKGAQQPDILTDAFALEADEVIPMRELEKRAIQRALRIAGGSVDKAAKMLELGRATLYRRLAHYDSIEISEEKP